MNTRYAADRGELRRYSVLNLLRGMLDNCLLKMLAGREDGTPNKIWRQRGWVGILCRSLEKLDWVICVEESSTRWSCYEIFAVLCRLTVALQVCACFEYTEIQVNLSVSFILCVIPLEMNTICQLTISRMIVASKSRKILEKMSGKRTILRKNKFWNSLIISTYRYVQRPHQISSNWWMLWILRRQHLARIGNL